MNTKYGIASLLILSVCSCTSPSMQKLEVSQTTYNSQDFKDLDAEYSKFSTKALTVSYLKKKIDKFVNSDPKKLVRELEYAKFKHPDVMKTVVLEADDPNLLYSEISTQTNVVQKRNVDSPFDTFVISLDPSPVVLVTAATISGETRINTYVTGNQSNQQIAMNASGDFVVVWESYGQDGGNLEDIFAQRYSAGGIPVGPEFQVNTYTTGFQKMPAVAINDNGEFAITWHGIGQEDSYGVYAQRYNSNGSKFASQFLVNTYTTDGQSNPSIAMDNTGNMFVTWQSIGQDGNSSGLYYQKFDSSNNRLEVQTERKVHSYTTGSQGSPIISGDKNGNFFVVWRGQGDGTYTDEIFMNAFKTGISQANYRINTYATGTQQNPSIAVNSAGEFTIAWGGEGLLDTSGIFAKRFNTNTTIKGAEFRVNTYTTATHSNYSPSVAMDSTGNFVVAWYGKAAGDLLDNIYAQRFDNTGAKVGSQFKVNTNVKAKYNPKVAMDSTGNFVITWASLGQDFGTSSGIYAKAYNANGTER